MRFKARVLSSTSKGYVSYRINLPKKFVEKSNLKIGDIAIFDFKGKVE